MGRVYPINSSEEASEDSLPGVNDFDLTRFPTNFLTEGCLHGVEDESEVTEHAGGANLSVDVGGGLNLIEITNTNVVHGKTSKTWYEESATTLAIAAADPTNPRKDRVIRRVRVDVDPNASASNIGVTEVLTGTPAGSPTAPAVPVNAIPLYTVNVAAGATSITNANLVDERTYVALKDDVLPDVARTAALLSTGNGEGASQIGIEDTAGNFSGTTVEDALAELAGGVPTGTLLQWLTDTAPTGFLLCYGQAVSRSTYSALFSVISTTFGVGDGSTTFNLPDMRGRFPLGQDDMGGSSANRVTDTDADTIGGADGAENVTLTDAQVPPQDTKFFSSSSGSDTGTTVVRHSNGADASIVVTAADTFVTWSSEGGGQAHNNMPPFLTVNYIIKA